MSIDFFVFLIIFKISKLKRKFSKKVILKATNESLDIAIEI